MNFITSQVFNEYILELFECVFTEIHGIAEFGDLDLFVKQCEIIKQRNAGKLVDLLKDEHNKMKYNLLKAKFDQDLRVMKEEIVKILDMKNFIEQLRMNTWID